LAWLKTWADQQRVETAIWIKDARCSWSLLAVKLKKGIREGLERLLVLSGRDLAKAGDAAHQNEVPVVPGATRPSA